MNVSAQQLQLTLRLAMSMMFALHGELQRSVVSNSLFFEALNSCEPGVCNYRDLYINLLSKHTPSFFVFFTLLLLINKLDLFCIKLHSITNRDQSGHVLLQAYKASETEFSHFYKHSQTIN